MHTCNILNICYRLHVSVASASIIRVKKVKVKCTLVQALRLCTGRTAHRGSRGIALLFLYHGTRRGEGSASRPGRSLRPGKTRYPLYRRLGGPQGRSGQVRKISLPPGFDPRTVQPVASRYTDYATQPTPSGYTTRILIKYTQTAKLHKEKHLMVQRLLVHYVIVNIALMHGYGTYYCNTFRLTCVAIIRVYAQGSCIDTNIRLSNVKKNVHLKVNYSVFV